MALTEGYSFDAGKIVESEITASELNHLFRVVDSQVRDALRAIGAGIVASPDGTSFEVLLSGGELVVNPGLAVVEETVNGHGFTGLESKVLSTVSDLSNLLDGDQNFLYAVAGYTYESSPSTASQTDAREGAPPTFLIQEDNEPVSGAILLAQLTSSGGSITKVEDRRTFIVISDLLLRMQQLESDVGYDDSEREKGSISERLDALETDDGSGGNGITYIGPGKWTAADPRAASTVIAEMIADAVNGSGASETMPMQLPEDRLGEAIMHTRDGLIRLSPAVADALEAAELVVGFSGHAADGSPPPTPGINDTENILLYSTLQMNMPLREMEP